MVRRALAVCAAVALAGTVPQAHAQDATKRVSEAVIVPGAELFPLLGTDVTKIAVRSFDGNSWLTIPSQVDQRDDTDNYTSTEGNNTLDANDEIVFLASDLGLESPSAPPIGGVHVTVLDPLAAGWSGHAYIGGSAPGDQSPPILVQYDETTREIATAAYTVGLASPAVDGFLGMKKLALAGDGTNRLDRTKIRLTVPQLGEFTEESLGSLGVIPPVEPVIAGPVRLVLSPTGGSFAYPSRAALTTLQLPAEIPPIPGLELRISMDFAPNASGAGYSDAYAPREHTIDGAPDTVQQILLAPWRQVRFPEGRLVMLMRGQGTPLLVHNYYKDDATVDTADTGDGMSYGDNGVGAISIGELAAVGSLGEMVFLGPESAATGTQLAQQLANPLTFSLSGNGARLFLPALWGH